MRALLVMGALGVTLGAAWTAARISNAVTATPDHSRNTEADLLERRNGELLLAWTRFSGGDGTDWTGAEIAVQRSKDRGLTWSAPAVLQENIGRMNVMEPDLLRLQSGKVLFLFCRKNSEADCRPMVRLSSDDAQSFSRPREMEITPSPSYTGFNHDRAIQLRGGRILMPVFFTPDYRVEKRIKTRVYRSDDEGRTWQAGPVVDVEESSIGAQEPGVVELKDGRVMLWLRTSTGFIYKSYSADRGVTWSKPVSMGIEAPVAPSSLKRHPGTGDLILVWNPSKTDRFPLAAAVSKDDGETWSKPRVIDATAGQTFAYTSIEFLSDRALLTYYAGPPRGSSSRMFDLKQALLPLGWFYE